MRDLSDRELLAVIEERLEAKDKAYAGLVELTGKLEELNRKLIESEDVKSSFLSNIRNEINNPLTSVLTMSEVLISGDELPDHATLRSIIGMIHKESFSLNFQLRNIFAAAELEAGEAVPGFSSVDMDSILKDVVSSLGHRAAEKKVSVYLDVQTELTEKAFRTDAEKVHRIATNLLANAIEFSPDGGEISVAAATEDGWLRISVRDRGPGIDPRDFNLLFERFRQLDSGASKQHLGHGLGLSIVKATVDLLGGDISVESSPGKGALFTVSVPEADMDVSTCAISMDGAEFFTQPETRRF
ncbi:MAG: HAMP domain-containing histidine kinase [Deltaproteobacteria bacterium]|nr:HAMP domain-containing histidine kinase [Deltaproteobacteria bacterium]MBZ0221196.1 HAMP domain-containing histidine kinase [Deltaproteobacteria bacterium]